MLVSRTKIYCLTVHLLIIFGSCILGCRCTPEQDLLNHCVLYKFTDHFHEALFARQNMTIDISRGEANYFLLYGWSQPEKDESGESFLWATNRESAVLVPLIKQIALTVTFDACPFSYTDSFPQQITVKLNNHKIGFITMSEGWRIYRVTIPKTFTHAGNNILSFSYSEATSPREVGRGEDIRKLAACYRYIRYGPAVESDVPIVGQDSDVCSVEKIGFNWGEESILVVPPTSSIKFSPIVPAEAFLHFRIGIRYNRNKTNLDKLGHSPVIFTIYQNGSNGEPELLFKETLSMSHNDTERLVVDGLSYCIQPKLGQKSFIISLRIHDAQSHIFLKTEQETISVTQPVQSFFLSPTIVGSWETVKFENVRTIASESVGKVFLIGLDGMTWDIVLPMIEKGELPNLNSLIERGFSSPLVSLLPSKSPMLWTSIATGKVSEKHGIVDYVSWDPVKKTRIPVTANLRKTKALWNIFSDIGKKVTVIGWWPSWPAEEVNGFMVADRRGGKDVPHQTYPPALWSDLNKNCQPEAFDYRKFLPAAPDLQLLKVGPYIISQAEADALEHTLMRVQQKDAYFARCAEYLLKREDPEFLGLYLNGADPVCHLFWKYAYPDMYGLKESESKHFQFIISGYYRYVDDLVGRILEYADKDTLIIIVSDHGFGGEFNRNFKININYLLEILGFYNKPLDNGSLGREKLIERGPSIDASLDQRMVFSDRVKQDPDLLQQVKQQLIQTFSTITSENTGYNPFILEWETGLDYDFVIKVDYRPMIDESLIINNKQIPFSAIFPEDFVSGSHGWAPDGIFIMCGPGVHKQSLTTRTQFLLRNSGIRKPSILDITPTILFAAGYPIGQDMDGRPYLEAFTKEFKVLHTVTMIPSYDHVGQVVNYDEKAIQSQQDEVIKNQLRILGYIN